MSLRRRLDGVATLAISQSHQTVEIAFTRGVDRFSPDEFRAALGEAGIELVATTLELCGAVESRDGQSSLHLGRSAVSLVASSPIAPGRHVCVTGTLQPGPDPAAVAVTTLAVLAQ